MVEVKVAKARRAEFIIGVRTRGEVRSVNSIILAAPQVPDPRIVRLVESGRPVKKGDVVVEFDAAQQEQTYLEKDTTVRTVDSETVQTKASHKMVDEQDGMNLMTSQYNVERAKLDASKAEVVSEIEGAKSRIDVGISEGELGQVNTTINAHDIHAEDRPRPSRAAEGQGGPRCGARQVLPVEDGAARSDRRHRQHHAQFPRLRLLRLRSSAVPRRRPRLDRGVDRRDPRSLGDARRV